MFVLGTFLFLKLVSMTHLFGTSASVGIGQTAVLEPCAWGSPLEMYGFRVSVLACFTLHTLWTNKQITTIQILIIKKMLINQKTSVQQDKTSALHQPSVHKQFCMSPTCCVAADMCWWFVTERWKLNSTRAWLKILQVAEILLKMWWIIMGLVRWNTYWS